MTKKKIATTKTSAEETPHERALRSLYALRESVESLVQRACEFAPYDVGDELRRHAHEAIRLTRRAEVAVLYTAGAFRVRGTILERQVQRNP